MNQYKGQWYELARLPNRFEKDCLHSITATYKALDDGNFEVVNRCATNDGENVAVGAAHTTDHSAKLQVAFAPESLRWLWLVWADYWVIYLESDYSTAIVSNEDGDYLWILSRSPTMSKEKMQRLTAWLVSRGFPIEQLVYVDNPALAASKD